MKILIVGDRLSSLNPALDSSLFIAQEFLRSGHEVVWTEEEKLSFLGTSVEVSGSVLYPWEGSQLPPVKDEIRKTFSSFDFCMIRKDPPFNESYLRLCWLLAPYEKKVLCVNRPSTLTRYHEKMLPVEAVESGFLAHDDLIPMLQARRDEELQEFLHRFPSTHYVVKPWLGYQGHRVQLLSLEEIKKFSLTTGENSIVQVFAPEIREKGDRRVLFYKGQMVGHFVRMPKDGDFVSNTAQGGGVTHRDLSKDEQKIIWKIEKFLQTVGIDFAGADLIGSRLSEINVTSPTGLRICEKLFGQNLAEKFVKDFGG